MSLIIATGSNLGNSLEHLQKAQQLLSTRLHLIKASRVYSSAAVDYQAQPDFLNQVLEFTLPASMTAEQAMQWLLEVEQMMGRRRDIPKGPRSIDLDIIFWGLETYQQPGLVIPHPAWAERSFVVRPLMELPFFQTLQKCFIIPSTFQVEARPLT